MEQRQVAFFAKLPDNRAAAVGMCAANAALVRSPPNEPIIPHMLSLYTGLLNDGLDRLALALAELEPKLLEVTGYSGETVLTCLVDDPLTLGMHIRHALAIGANPNVWVSPRGGARLIVHAAQSACSGIVPLLHQGGAPLDKVASVLITRALRQAPVVLRLWPTSQQPFFNE